MIHDANDTHLDGHTFTTGDTTVTLTWTETSYGEKTYTKLLNGASIGTETITLTDPNASTSLTYSSEYQSLVGHAEPQIGDYLYYNNNGTPTQTEWVILDVYSDNDIRYKKNQSGWSTYQQKNRGIGWTGSGWTEDPWSLSTDKEPDLLSNDGTFSSASATCLDGATIYTWTTGGASYAEGSFISPFYEAPSNYNLQSFTYNGLTADENESLTEYQGLWRAWDWTWVEGDGDGVIYTKSDWTLHKNTDGSFYVVKTVDGFTSGNFSPDANGIATITFNWNEHTAIMFKPPA